MDALYSKSLKAGKSTYFIDVLESKNGNRYLSVSESQKNGDGYKRTTIRIFGDTIAEFRQAIDEAGSIVAHE